jgi:hypothetical protein
MFFRVFGAVLVIGSMAVGACAGPTGPEGPPGPAGDAGPPGPAGSSVDGGVPYGSRSDLYCNMVTVGGDAGLPLGSTDGQALASCNAISDLPISGGCNASQPSFLQVTSSFPDGWSESPAVVTHAPAQWMCEFSGNSQYVASNATDVYYLATSYAIICCVPGH